MESAREYQHLLGQQQCCWLVKRFFWFGIPHQEASRNVSQWTEKRNWHIMSQTRPVFWVSRGEDLKPTWGFAPFWVILFLGSGWNSFENCFERFTLFVALRHLVSINMRGMVCFCKCWTTGDGVCREETCQVQIWEINVWGWCRHTC